MKKSSIPRLLVAGSILASSLLLMPCQAQQIADKIEYQGSSRYVVISGLKTQERGGITSLQIELQNPDNRPRQVYWRVKWLDEAGFQVWDDEPWKPALVQGSSRLNLVTSSPTQRARDFRIQFNAENNSWMTPSTASTPSMPEPPK